MPPKKKGYRLLAVGLAVHAGMRGVAPKRQGQEQNATAKDAEPNVPLHGRSEKMEGKGLQPTQATAFQKPLTQANLDLSRPSV